MRDLKFRIVYKNKIIGYERLKESDSNIYWEWMALELNTPNFERWNRGVFPHGFEYLRNQFTGLLDKKKKEIYSRDLVKRPITMMPNKKYDIAEIQYFEDRFILKWITKCEWNDSIRAHINDIEVIGNVYETPGILP